MKRREIQQKIAEAMTRHIQLTYKVDGTKKLYDAACFVGDKEEEQKLRLQQHALLDAQMDVQADLMTFSRMLVTAPD